MNEKTKNRLTFIINVCYCALVAAMVYLAAKHLVRWLLPFIIGLIVAVFLRPAVRWLALRSRASPKFVGGIIMVLAYVVFISLLFWGGSALAARLEAWFSGIPDFGANVVAPAISSLEDFIADKLGGIFPEMAGSSNGLISAEDLQGILISVSTALVAAVGGLTAKLPAFLLALLFSVLSSLIISVNYDETVSFLTRQVPAKYHNLLMTVKSNAFATVARYFIAYLKLMVITFALLCAGLMFLGVPNAVIAAFGIALFDLLPVLGTGGIMVPWALLCMLGQDYTLAAGIIILYGVVTVTRNIIEPKIIGDQLGLPPLAALCAIYVGFKLFGVIGMIVFPISVQIVAGLQKTGAIKIWK